jgi:hypothetical protein
MRRIATISRHLSAIVAAGALCVPASAHAQSATDAALAEALIREGKDLMVENRFAEACPKLAESQRLAPGMGTQLSLAICHEGEKKLALAWAEYSQVLPAARRAGRQDRADYAEQRIKALEPRLSRLTIDVPQGAAAPGFEVRVGDLAISRAAFGVAAPMDGATYTVTARAPGYQTWSRDVQVKPEGDDIHVSVPPLVPVPATENTPAPPPEATAGAPVPADVPARTTRPLTTPVYISGGVAIALAVASTVTGIVAVSRASDFTDKNHDPAATQAERQSARDGAASMGNACTVLTLGTLVAAGVTGYLYVTRPVRAEGVATARISPWAAPGSAGLSVGGAF